MRLHRRLAPLRVLIVILVVGLALTAALTAAAGAVYDAVVEADGVAALDHPALDAAKAARTPPLTTLVQAFTTLGGPIGMPVLATVVAVGLGVAWRQWTPVLLIAATAAGSLTLTIIGKAAVGRTRPPLADAVPPDETVRVLPQWSHPELRGPGRRGRVSADASTAAQACPDRDPLLRLRVRARHGAEPIYLGYHWLTDVLVA
jgi:undecaprenyl-diphosphatase